MAKKGERMGVGLTLEPEKVIALKALAELYGKGVATLITEIVLEYMNTHEADVQAALGIYEARAKMLEDARSSRRQV